MKKQPCYSVGYSSGKSDDVGISVSEPSAAALACRLYDQETDFTALVFDFGGGTLDVSVVHCFDNMVSVLAVSGDNRLGGADFDRELAVAFCVANNLFFEDGEDITYFWNNTLCKDEKSVLLELCFFIKEEQKYVRRDEIQRQYIHETQEVLAGLKKAGFTAQVFSFQTRDAPKQQDERIQFVAVKG